MSSQTDMIRNRNKAAGLFRDLFLSSITITPFTILKNVIGAAGNLQLTVGQTLGEISAHNIKQIMIKGPSALEKFLPRRVSVPSGASQILSVPLKDVFQRRLNKEGHIPLNFLFSGVSGVIGGFVLGPYCIFNFLKFKTPDVGFLSLLHFTQGAIFLGGFDSLRGLLFRNEELYNSFFANTLLATGTGFCAIYTSSRLFLQPLEVYIQTFGGSSILPVVTAPPLRFQLLYSLPLGVGLALYEKLKYYFMVL